MLLLSGMTTGAHAQFLNKLKEKAEKTISNAASSGEKSSKKKDSSKGQSSSTQTYASSQGENIKSGATEPASQYEISDNLFNGEEIPDFLKRLPASNMFDFCDLKFPQEPPVASNAASLYIDGDMFYFSPFSDGVAYMDSYESGKFFFDRQGRKLFNVSCKDGDDHNYPRFENGVVMVVPDRRKYNGGAFIYDKQGNVVKELKNVYDASNFNDGVAAVLYYCTNNKIDYFYELKYVDTKGNFIYPSLNFTTEYLTKIIYEPFVMMEMSRKGSEGLTPFCNINNKGEHFWGFRDSAGNVVIRPQYGEVSDFHEGLCAVKVKADNPDAHGAKDRWGFIDKTGKMVIPTRYSNRPSDFDSGMALVTDRNDFAYYIDKSGNTRLGPIGDRNIEAEDTEDGKIMGISPFYNGHALALFAVPNREYNVIETYYTGIIDTNFKLQSWGEKGFNGYTGAAFANGDDGKFYVKGGGHNEIIWVKTPSFMRPMFKQEDLFREGLSRFRSINHGGHIGYMDENGKIVLEIKQNDF